MRINVLQHTPNEGPGAIQRWAQMNDHEMFVYHPYYFGGILPSESECDLLIILGGPMSPNDNAGWIKEERKLILELIAKNKPIFGACFGAQQIAKALGYIVKKAPHKEVGWAPVYLQSGLIPNIPKKITALHWHEDMFQIPNEAEYLFSSDLNENQGFIYKNVLGLQFHFEPENDNLREMITNDAAYALTNNDLMQSPNEILTHSVPNENSDILFKLLDYIVNPEFIK